MSERPAPLYYSLEPVHPPAPGAFHIASAAVVTCMATGRVLEGHGGGGLALATDIVQALDMDRAGSRSRMVLDARDYETAKAALAAVAHASDDAERAAAVARARDALASLERAEDEGRAPGSTKGGS